MSGYSKLFSEIVTSSIWSEDDKTRIVWITMLALKDGRGFVPAALPGLANAARVTIDECARAIAKLEAADKYSRTPDNDGRRVQRIDGGWIVLNHDKYRDKRGDEARREYQRRWQAERRRRQNVDNVDTNVDSVDMMLTHADADADADKNKEKKVPMAPAHSARFLKPTADEVTTYAKSKGIELDGERFCSFYESNGWKVGRNPMKSWRAAITGTWKTGTGRHEIQAGSQHKLYPDQALKLRDEWQSKRRAFWSRHAIMTAQGEQLPADRKAEYETIRAKIQKYEGML